MPAEIERFNKGEYKHDKDDAPCLHCGHGETAHNGDADGCIGCMLEIAPSWRTGISWRHNFEGLPSYRTTLLADDMARVRSVAAGEEFSLAGREYVVRAPCGRSEPGHWACLTHAMSFSDNTDKDAHCFVKLVKSGHRLLWNCYVLGLDGHTHGPEAAG